MNKLLFRELCVRPMYVPKPMYPNELPSDTEQGMQTDLSKALALDGSGSYRILQDDLKKRVPQYNGVKIEDISTMERRDSDIFDAARELKKTKSSAKVKLAGLQEKYKQEKEKKDE